MFITWRLWYLLRYPPRQHPSFRWLWLEQQSGAAVSQQRRTLFVRDFLVFAIVAGIILSLPFFVIEAVYVLLFILPLLALPVILNGTFLGLYWVVAITDILARHWRDQRAELLGVTTRGTLGLSWMLATVQIQRGDRLRAAYRVVRGVAGAVLVLMGLAVLGMGLQLREKPLQSYQVHLLVDLTGMMALILAAWLDHIQSIVLAALVAVLSPTYSLTQPTLRLSTIGVYLAVQAGFYVVMLLCLVLVESLAVGLWESVLAQRLMVVSIGLLMFYLLREVLINLLWRLMLRRYQSTAAEFVEVIS